MVRAPRAPPAGTPTDAREGPAAAAEGLLAPVDAHGTSDVDVSVSELIAANRAGPNQEAPTVEEILDRYAR
jgi:hypothetical protein